MPVRGHGDLAGDGWVPDKALAAAAWQAQETATLPLPILCQYAALFDAVAIDLRRNRTNSRRPASASAIAVELLASRSVALR